MKTITTFIFVLLAFSCGCAILAAPVYNIAPLGLVDLEHTRSDGYRSSHAQELNEAGHVIGYSERFDGNKSLGRSAWLHNGATTINAGLTGIEHTRSDGYKTSTPARFNEAGQGWGESYRFNGGGTELGRSIWLFNGATTIDIGLTGSEYTQAGGVKYSFGQELNEAGQVIGRSQRYKPGILDFGWSAWLYDGATTIEIGLSDIEHTARSGAKQSSAHGLNESGQVVGTSWRFNGDNSDLGRSAWFYDGATTVNIGLTGSEYTRNDGYKFNVFHGPDFLNESGHVTGTAFRYSGSTQVGHIAWLYDGATTTEIGPTDSEHTQNDGSRISLAVALNESGQVIGRSARYNGGNSQLGESAWLYDGVTTINVGLTDSEHIRDDGYKYSIPSQLNEAGQAIGLSFRFDGSMNVGQSTWLYDGVTTTDIGLTGSDYTRDDGSGFSHVVQLTEAGWVSGYSFRFNGGSITLGRDSWVYDPVLEQTFPLQLSTRSDGYAESSVQYLGEDGLALGSYELFDALDNSLGFRAFYFTAADGVHDLGSLVEGGLTANGWDYLATALRANRRGQILGYGKLTSQSFAPIAYLLTPVVPEPNAMVLAVLGAVGLSRLRRLSQSR